MSILTLLRAYISRETLKSFRKLLDSILYPFHFFIAMAEAQLQPVVQVQSQDPPPFDPLKPSVPISYPVKTLKDLKSGAYFHSFHYPFNKSSIFLENAALQLPNRRRILVCHDMQGGYVDDKWVQGGTNADAYAIWHWHLMDIFVYFSHNLVTLPPPCWTNTAHRHGVKVLGTFILEWAEGRIIANELLSTKESAHLYAECLAKLASDLKFDGWLLNMEVQLDVKQIPNMKEFISHLTQTMHSKVQGSLVIWYDSVTIDGKLEWQDQLNEKNKPFFDLCDGIFVNYTWKENYPNLSALAAGDRQYDVYMGIDVFGRNTYGGGKWDTHVALDLLKKDDVSAAIFGPGWVYETKQPPDFETAQNRWWSLVEKSWGVLEKYPKALPYYTNFDQGRGLHISIEGEQVSSASWNNISSQGFQPFLEFNDDPSSDTIQVLVDFKEASYNGGANLTFKGTLENNARFTARLFEGELLLGDSPVYFSYSVKSKENSLLGLIVEFSSATKERELVSVTAEGIDQFSSKFKDKIAAHRFQNASEWSIMEGEIEMNGYIMTGISAVCYRQDPVDLASGPAEYFAMLGHVTVKTTGQSSYFPPYSSWHVKHEYIEWTSGSQGSKNLSMKISWKLLERKGNFLQFPKYNVYVEKLAEENFQNRDGSRGTPKYLGAAHVQAFYVSNLTVPSGVDSLKFIIQACDNEGSIQELDDSPFLQLDV